MEGSGSNTEALAPPRGRGGVGLLSPASVRPLRRGIGLRLLTLIILFSSAVTLVSTVAQLYFDFRRDVSAIRERLVEIEHSYLDSLASSLWHIDTEQLRLQLEGLLRLPDMQALEVRETASALPDPLVVRVGVHREGLGMTKTYPIVYHDRGVQRTIGELKVEATFEQVYLRLIDRALVILATQGVKTFVVSLFILWIVHRLVTRHLVAIADHLARWQVAAGAPLTLHRRHPPQADELDQVVLAFNEASAKLDAAYHDLRDANRALARDNVARRRAEAEVTALNAQLERRVRKRTAELEAANGELSAFSYSVSHDLRAPLRRIEGFSQMVSEGYAGQLDDKGRHYLDRIRAGAHEMADMIDSFLKLSRATRGELAVEDLDMTAIAQDVLTRLAEKDPDRMVRAEVQPGMSLRGDRRLMTSALTNLLDNAWKYTRRTPEAVISVAAETDAEGHPVFTIADNGAGFDMAFVDRLFTPFHRLHKPEEFEGIGIGLATVQRVIARHGGRIWAEGAPGRGARFHFTCWEGRAPDEQQPDDPAGRG